MYITTRGNEWTLNRETWGKIKACAYKRFEGSGELFNACWKQYRAYLKGSIDNPEDIADVMDWLDSIASEKVNNPASRYYIYG